MPDEAIKRRIAYAKKAARKHFEEDENYTIINSDNKIICFTATFGSYLERKIRVVVDEISDLDIKLIKDLNITQNQTKEIWCKKKDDPKFFKKGFNKDNQPIKRISCQE